ncbi:MAG TPA: trigger factor [Verrucomicrobiae bacterium]|nr:trigger factor [Verrucomicrobiae bacterium]
MKSTGTIDRTMVVELAAEQVDKEVSQRLQSLAAELRVDGFRPGKAPWAVVKKRYEASVRQEVLEKLAKETFQQAADTYRLRVTGSPVINFEPMEDGRNPHFVANFQVYPEIKIGRVDTLQIRRPVATVQNADLEKMIAVIRRQHAEWNDVARPAQRGDRVVVDFERRVNGKSVEGGRAKGHSVELGWGGESKEFEAALVGMSAGEEKVVAITFPENHSKKHLRGQTVSFRLKVKRVSEPVLPTVDLNFIKKLGIVDGSPEAFRAEVTNNMTRELQHTIQSQLKQQVVDGLAALHDFDIPESLVADEIRRLREEISPNATPSVDGLTKEHMESQAAHRVKVRLIVDAVIRQQGLQPEPARVAARLQDLASTCTDPTALIDYYRSHPPALRAIEEAVLEEQAVEWVLKQASVTDEVCDFDSVMKSHQMI